MIIYRLHTILVMLMTLQWSYGQDTSQLLYLEDSKLTYVPFAMTGQSNMVHTIPDFSFAGYMGGGVAIPTDIPVRATVFPEEGDDVQRIQEAINQVELLDLDESGFRGVVLLKAGHYSLSNLLAIRKSGVIFRGEGQGLNGTVLHANPKIKHSVLSILGDGGILKSTDQDQPIVSDYVPVGSYSFEVHDATAYEVGDEIVITRTPNQNWIEELGMDQETLCAGDSGCTGWTPNIYKIDHERTITNISGNVITVDIPMVDVIENRYGGGVISKVESSRRINQCGVENLRIQSFYQGNSDELHAWTAVRLKYTEDCWVKNVTGQYLAYSTVNIEDSNYTTVQDCAYIDPKSIVTGGRRYSFAIQKGIGNFFQRCYAIDGRHDFITGSRVTGPNVFLDGLAESAESDIGPHHRWATGTLFDNLRGGSIRVWNRGNAGSGHGWAGAQTMFWNLNSYHGEFRVDSPKGAINWGIGCIGTNQTGEGYWESWGANLNPRSLYLQQLQDRLGTNAVENIIIPEQRSGNIYDVLSAWGGQGDFSRGGIQGQQPEVSFKKPGDQIDVSTWEGGDIQVEANDSDGTIQNIKLLINGEPLAIDDEAPYIFSDFTETIQNLTHEIHYLQAIATDNDDNTNITRISILGGDPPIADDEDDDEAEQFENKIFPNPVRGKKFTIEMMEDMSYLALIFDSLGRKVEQITFTGNQYEYNGNHLSKGIYFLKVQAGDDIIAEEKILIL